MQVDANGPRIGTTPYLVLLIHQSRHSRVLGGKKRAANAVSRSILVTADRLLRDGTEVWERG